MEKLKLALSAEILPADMQQIEEYYTVKRLPWTASDYLPTEEDMVSQCAGSDVVCVYTDPLPASCLERLAASGVQAIGCGRATPNNIDWPACHKLGLPLFHTPGRNAYAVGEYTVGLILALAKRIPFTYHGLQTGRFLAEEKDIYDVPDRKDVIWRFPDRENPRSSYPWSIDVFGRTIGLVGCGFIGRHTAAICRAMGMEVLAYDPFQPAERLAELGIRRIDDPMDMLPQCDFVSIHLNVTDETRGLVDQTWFDAMRPDAYFINTARAAVVDQFALIDALEKKKIAFAAVDVMWDEPAPRNHPLLHMDNVIVTPHMAGICSDVKKWASQMLREDLIAFARRQPMQHLWRRLS